MQLNNKYTYKPCTDLIGKGGLRFLKLLVVLFSIIK